MKKNITNTGKNTLNSAAILRKEAKARMRARRTQKLLRLGLTDEQKEEILKDQNIRTILCLYYSSYTVENGTKEVRVGKKKDNKTEVVPNILHGRHAAEFTINKEIEALNHVTVLKYGPTYCWIKLPVEDVEKVSEILKPIGRFSVTKHSLNESIKKVVPKEDVEKKPSNNNKTVAAEAKARRKDENKKRAAMRPYYAALRKGGVSARIKKHNKKFALKIESWIKDRIAKEKKKHEKIVAKDNRQLTSIERKNNKRMRKLAKQKATRERRIDMQKKREIINAKEREKRIQKVQKPVQTKLDLAA